MRHGNVGDAADGTRDTPGGCLGRAESLLRETFDSFDSAGIRWCLLRPAATSADDVDLLVARPDWNTARKVAMEHGFVPLSTLGRGSHRFLVGYDPASDGWAQLDAVLDLRFGPGQELRLPGAAACLARRVREGEVFVPAPADAFWALLLHVLLDEGRIAESHRARLQELAAGPVIGGPLASEALRACPDLDGERLVDDVRSGRWDEVMSAASRLRSGLAGGDRARSVLTAVVSPVLRKATRVFLLRSRGMTVALVGPDGVGKSSLTAALASRFAFPVVSVYMGLHGDASGARNGERPMPLPARIARHWMRYLRGQVHRWRGRLVVFDRYTLDALLTPRRYQSRLRRWARRILGRSIPLPDLTLLLDAPAQVVFQRKPDLSVGLLERRRREYLRMAEADRRIRVVDASAPADEVRRRVTELVWEAYLERSRRSLGGSAR